MKESYLLIPTTLYSGTLTNKILFKHEFYFSEKRRQCTRTQLFLHNSHSPKLTELMKYNFVITQKNVE